MPRQSLGDLKNASKRFRPNTKRDRFETKARCIKEDLLRARHLRSLRNRSVLCELQKTKIKLLEQKLLGQFKNDCCAASSVYMRKIRKRVIGNIAELLLNSAGVVARIVTLVPPSWQIASGDLLMVDLPKLLQALRSDLNRAGATQARGWAALFLHGEFEPLEQIYQLHVHGVATGEMIKVIDGLRTRPKYAPQAAHPGQLAVARPVQVKQKEITNLRSTIGYQFKSYWNERRVGPVGAGNNSKRTRDVRRIQEPHHSEVLLFLDRYRAEDLALMVGLRVQEGRLHPTKS